MDRIVLPERTLVFVAGGTCTGKTTLLNILIPKVEGGYLIDKDTISDSMMRTPDIQATGGTYDISWFKLNGPRHSISREFYRDNIGKQAYHAMLEIAVSNFSFPLVPFLQANYTAQMKEGYFPEIVFPFFREIGISPRYKMLFCYASKEVMAKRIRERNDPRDASKLVSDEALWRYLNNQDLIPERLKELDHLKLNGENDLEKNVEKALEYLVR
jgi:dephospho-CoA kinase